MNSHYVLRNLKNTLEGISECELWASYNSNDIAHIASSVISSLILKSSHFSIYLASGILIYAAFLSCLTLFPQQWKVIMKPRAQHKRQHSARVKKTEHSPKHTT